MKNYMMNLFIISVSPWPLVMSLCLLLLFMNMLIYFYNNIYISFLLLNIILTCMIMLFWWSDVVVESNNKGFHNFYIMMVTINSMIMFIVSEVFFFISFFWTFFHSMFSPDVMIGSMWPMNGIIVIDYMSLPMLNSLLLISSGCSVTWSHYKIMGNNIISSKNSLFLTILLGIMFIMCQAFEYKFSNFSFSDGIYGSVFFIMTGFHGIHVIIGDLFLMMMFIRMVLNHFSSNHMMGFEFSIWYWHFVDVVWLYLYMMVYWLGS